MCVYDNTHAKLTKILTELKIISLQSVGVCSDMWFDILHHFGFSPNFTEKLIKMSLNSTHCHLSTKNVVNVFVRGPFEISFVFLKYVCN